METDTSVSFTDVRWWKYFFIGFFGLILLLLLIYALYLLLDIHGEHHNVIVDLLLVIVISYMLFESWNVWAINFRRVTIKGTTLTVTAGSKYARPHAHQWKIADTYSEFDEKTIDLRHISEVEPIRAVAFWQSGAVIIRQPALQLKDNAHHAVILELSTISSRHKKIILGIIVPYIREIALNNTKSIARPSLPIFNSTYVNKFFTARQVLEEWGAEI